MVLIFTLSLDVEVHMGRVAETLEEMKEHLGGHRANLLAMELGIPYKPGTPTEVERHLATTIVPG